MAQQASLWLDIRDLFGEEHVEEWESQEFRTVSLNDLERATEAEFQARILTRRDDKRRADSKEAAAQELPPEWHAEREQRQAKAMPLREDVSSTSARVPLYPNWVLRPCTKPPGRDTPAPYRAPRDTVAERLSLAEELDEASVLDPLSSSQQDASETPKAEGPNTPPHYCNAPAVVPPFDLSQLGVFPQMSPVTEQENELLNLAPGSPVRHHTAPALNPDQNRSQQSSYTGSPMSLGSPVGTSSLARALQVRAHPATPAVFNDYNRQEDDECMDAAETGVQGNQE